MVVRCSIYPFTASQFSTCEGEEGLVVRLARLDSGVAISMFLAICVFWVRG